MVGFPDPRAGSRKVRSLSRTAVSEREEWILQHLPLGFDVENPLLVTACFVPFF